MCWVGGGGGCVEAICSCVQLSIFIECYIWYLFFPNIVDSIAD